MLSTLCRDFHSQGFGEEVRKLLQEMDEGMQARVGATPTSCLPVVGVVLAQEEREGGESEAWMVVVGERGQRDREMRPEEGVWI